MSREAVLRRRVVSLQVAGEVVHVRPLTGAQVERVLALGGDESIEGIRALSLVCCFAQCDESGARVWADDDLDTIREEGDFPAVKAIAEKALEVSGLGDDSGNG